MKSDLRPLFEEARLTDKLLNNTTWRHINSQAVYQIEGLAYDSDREEIVVQYRTHELIGDPIVFSHLKSRFLNSFERVELTQVWEVARGDD